MHVRPVVEDVAEQVHLRAAHGLRREEVVRHERDAVRDAGGDHRGRTGGADGEHVREVLHDEVQVYVGLREGDADVAAGAADVDDGGC